jgi:hypothetical protein
MLMEWTYTEECERKIDETDALLRQTVEHLSTRYSPHLVGQAARDKLLDLSSHLQEALGSLADIEGRRNLTDEELARRRAFKMLLAAALL